MFYILEDLVSLGGTQMNPLDPRPRAPCPLRAVARPDDPHTRRVDAALAERDAAAGCGRDMHLRPARGAEETDPVAEKAAEQTGTRRGRVANRDRSAVDRRIYRSVGYAEHLGVVGCDGCRPSGVSVNDAIETLVIRADTPPNVTSKYFGKSSEFRCGILVTFIRTSSSSLEMSR